ncbi:hypothetical protein GOBAR_DD29019 [Gossypium barbadense]|nr:hypothetical protein GOBAR_DD29019 [Gossypium barbadense]
MLLRSGRRTLKSRANFTDQQAESYNPHAKPNDPEDIDMANQTLKQLVTPNLAAQPPSITYPALDRPLKLNSRFLNLLPNFNGLPGPVEYDGGSISNLTAMVKGEANAVFLNQRRYDPYSATYNEGWRDHPNF